MFSQVVARESAGFRRRGCGVRPLLPTSGPRQDLYYGGGTSESAVLVTNGDVLMYGNKFSCYPGRFYNPCSNTWTRTQGQCGNNVSFGPLLLLGTGKVLLAGDLITYSAHTSGTARSAFYDPSTNTWTGTGSLLQAMRRTATLLLYGRVLSVGGSDAGYFISPNPEKAPGGAGFLAGLVGITAMPAFASGTCQKTGSMNVARIGHTATLLSNGDVLVAGGDNSGSAELYNPSTGVWTLRAV